MSRKSLLLSTILFLYIGMATLITVFNKVPQTDSCIIPFPRNAAGSTQLLLNDGQEGYVANNTATNVTVTSNGNLVSAANQVDFLVNYTSDIVINASVKMSFSNSPFNALKTPQPITQMNVLYLKVETNVSAAVTGVKVVDGVDVTLHYNQTEIYFTERALWVYSYDLSANIWTRLDNTKVSYTTDSLNFQMPAGTLIELALVGQETRGLEFPPWAWFFILLSFGLIAFMAVGELVYQGYIHIAMKGTDGRVMVALKRFLGGWGRIFTQLNDKVTGYIDYYQDMAAPVPPLPPEKRPLAVSSLGHLNRLGLREDAEALEEVYKPIETPSKPLVIAKIDDKNPLAKAVFEESSPEVHEEEPSEKTFTPYIPAAVRAKQVENLPPKPVIESPKEAKPNKPAPVITQKPTPTIKPAPVISQKPTPTIKPAPVISQKPLPTVKPAPSETKTEQLEIPPDLMQEATAAIKKVPAPEEITKPAKKAAKKKAAKKTSKKAAKKTSKKVAKKPAA